MNLPDAADERHAIFSLHPRLPDLNRPSHLYVGLHVVSPDPAATNNVPPANVRRLLADAHEHGWSVNLIDDNPRKLILTFDDGRPLGDELIGLMDEFGATGVFFVSTYRYLPGYDPARPYAHEMSEADRRYLLSRHVIGSHTQAHAPLPAMTAAEQRRRLEQDFSEFEQAFGFRPWCFSYPWGLYNAATLRAIKSLGVRSAFLAAPGGGAKSPSHPYTIPRVFPEAFRLPPERFTLNALLEADARRKYRLKSLIRRAHALAAVGQVHRRA